MALELIHSSQDSSEICHQNYMNIITNFPLNNLLECFKNVFI